MSINLSEIIPNHSGIDGPGELSIGAKRRWPLVITVISVIILVLSGSAVAWYKLSERPVDPAAQERVTFTVEQGMTPVEIGELLHENGLIRSVLAYRIYIKLNGAENGLKAGTYKIAPSEDLSQVVDNLTAGEIASVSITFFPGSTIFDPTNIEDSKRTDVYTILRRAGYSDEEVRSALGATYDSPLFQDKPTDTSLEGYIYGETYLFSADATARQVLEHSFDVYYQAIEQYDVVNGAKKQGLNLYEAITLASIVQREVSGYEDMRKVAQVFLTRLQKGMMLGSDVTFIYAAQQDNQEPAVNYESPYNTRKYPELPPGPISNPGIEALRAVVNPADTEYLYFVAGEDGKTYFAYDEAEHEQNVANYCGYLCE